MAPFLTIGLGVLSGVTASGNRFSSSAYRVMPQKQTSTGAAVVDFLVVNKLGDNFHKLHSFLNLKNGWNGYDGKSFSKLTINRTLSILKKLNVQPKMFPTGRGTIQLEYHIDDDNLVEMEVSSTEISVLWVIDGNESEEEISDIRVASKKLNDFIS